MRRQLTGRDRSPPTQDLGGAMTEPPVYQQPQPPYENPSGMQPGGGRGAPAHYGWQQPPAPTQQPGAGYLPPQFQPAPPPVSPRSTRRRILTGALASLPVLGALGYFAARLGHHGAAAVTGAGGGFNPANEDPSSLPSAAAGPNTITDAEIQALLAKANAALKARDEQAYVALFAAGPTANQARTTFRNLGENIALVHQVKGVDVGHVAQWYRWTLTRTGSGTPVITTSTGSPAVFGSDKYVNYPGVHDSEHEIEVERVGPVILVAETAADAAVMRRYASQIAAGYQNDLDLWLHNGGASGISPGALYMFTSSDKLDSWFGGAAKRLSNEAGLATPLEAADWLKNPTAGPPTYAGARIALNLQSDFFTTDKGETSVYCLAKHEGTHAMLFPLMTADQQSVPYYDVEGFADWSATREFAHAVQAYFRDPDILAYARGAAAARWDRKLPTNAEVYSPDGNIASASYGLATMVFYYTESAFGLPAAIKLV